MAIARLSETATKQTGLVEGLKKKLAKLATKVEKVCGSRAPARLFTELTVRAQQNAHLEAVSEALEERLEYLEVCDQASGCTWLLNHTFSRLSHQGGTPFMTMTERISCPSDLLSKRIQSRPLQRCRRAQLERCRPTSTPGLLQRRLLSAPLQQRCPTLTMMRQRR